MNIFAFDIPSDGLLDLLQNARKDLTVMTDTVNLMANSAFVLTGSRRFGTCTPYSDYDYFIKKSLLDLGLDDKLFKLGFRRKSSSSFYRDVSLSFVMTNGYIDVQVIEDQYYDAKVKAQDLFEKLVRNNEVQHLSKSELRNIWTNLILISMK